MENTDANTNIPPYQDLHWHQLGNSMHGKQSNFDDLGQRVAISHDGNRVVLGPAWGYDRQGPASVRVFDFNGDDWEEAGRFLGRSEDYFGKGVALSGDGRRIAIGADASEDWRGNVEIYQYNKETASWDSMGKLVGLLPNGRFGWSVSLSANGNRVAIGAVFREDQDPNPNKCSVHVFEYIGDVVRVLNDKWRAYAGGSDWSALVMEFMGSSWQSAGQTIVADRLDWFDGALDVSSDGRVVAVGSPEGRGSVRIFRNSSGWVPLGQALYGVNDYDRFGFSLSVNAEGDIIAVGGGRGDSYIRVFSFDIATQKWNRMGNAISIERCFGGVSLSSGQNRIAVGSYNADGTHGSVEIFDYDGEDWVPRRIQELPSEKFFGSSVSLSFDGDRLAFGSLLDRTAHLRVYKLSGHS